ncbi:hypothetical protein V6N13_047200 [Hibiscus sabdariffa]
MFSPNQTVFCWGDESSSHVISLIPKEMRFHTVADSGYHVCGILEGSNSRAFCWGSSLNLEELSVAYSHQGNVDLPPKDPMLTVVGGKFHACGIRRYDHEVVCWGFIVKLTRKSFLPVCWGVGFPTSLPLAISPGSCKDTPFEPGSYEVSQDIGIAPCKAHNFHICMPCCNGCPAEMYQKSECTLKSNRVCDYNCSSCKSAECFSNCSSSYSDAANERKNERLRNCRCSTKDLKSEKANGSASYNKDNGKICFDFDELNIRRARMYTYEELEMATGGFKGCIGGWDYCCSETGDNFFG